MECCRKASDTFVNSATQSTEKGGVHAERPLVECLDDTDILLSAYKPSKLSVFPDGCLNGIFDRRWHSIFR